jgi:magnesium chelatase family protein
MLVAAMNPCPCGYFTDPSRECTCTPGQVHKYRHRISGPLLDRIDLQVEVPAVPYQELSGTEEPEPSRVIRERVRAARARQSARFASAGGTFVNAHMGPRLLREHGRLDADGQRLLRTAIERLGLSARAYHRILKVARTLADLSGEGSIRSEHLSEAIAYRTLDRRFWGRAGT